MPAAGAPAGGKASGPMQSIPLHSLPIKTHVQVRGRPCCHIAFAAVRTMENPDNMNKTHKMAYGILPALRLYSWPNLSAENDCPLCDRKIPSTRPRRLRNGARAVAGRASVR
jgi:hypothetical protein